MPRARASALAPLSTSSWAPKAATAAALAAAAGAEVAAFLGHPAWQRRTPSRVPHAGPTPAAPAPLSADPAGGGLVAFFGGLLLVGALPTARRRGSDTAVALLGGAKALGPRRSRHVVCRFFGGKDKSKEESSSSSADDEGGKEEAEEEEQQQPEELSEAQKAACEKLQAEIDELKELAGEKRAAHERLELEVKNFRKRTREELAAARGQAVVPLVKELLPIADEYDLAKQNLKVETDGEKAIEARFSAVFDQLMATWNAIGVQKLVALGEPFNPELHEAVSVIPSPEYKEDMVCNELRAGWVLKPPGAEESQVIRASLVCVSSGPGPS